MIIVIDRSGVMLTVKWFIGLTFKGLMVQGFKGSKSSILHACKEPACYKNI
jgi:hypothetical protein